MLAKYYQFLKELVELKTISWEKKSTPDIKKASILLKERSENSGMKSIIVEWYDNPIVVSSYVFDKNLPTCLIYWHYDVQPAHKSEWWKQDPFSLYIGKDKIFGRWVADNKWQFLIHFLTVGELIKSKKLWYNVIFLIEGNEENWSWKLESFLRDFQSNLKSDFCLISDSEIIDDSPCIDVWYNWWFNAKLKIITAKTDLHSGVYGWMVPNPIQEINKLLSKLYDYNNHITIPYFYYDVEDIDPDVAVRNKRIKFDANKFMNDTWVKTILKDKEFDLFTQIWLRPRAQIISIDGWYRGEWFKGAIPGSASAVLDFRLVKNQDPQKIISSFEQRIKWNIPWYVDYEIEFSASSKATKVNMKNSYIKKAESILKDIFAKPVIYRYSGGTLTVVNLLDSIISVNNVLIPLANGDSNMHGVNENMDIDLIEKWLKFSYEFLRKG